MHPALRPVHRRVWRDPATLQCGLDPARSTVIGGISPAVARVLAGLDGRQDMRTAVTQACAAPDRPAAEALVGLLAQGGCLDETPPPLAPAALAPDVAALTLQLGSAAAAGAAFYRRRASVVHVEGAGRVGAPLAAQLAAAGVGTVVLEDPGPATPADLAPGGLRSADLGRPRGSAAARRLHRPGRAQPDPPRLPAGPPALVVLAMAGPGTPDPAHTASLVRRGLPHLAVGVRETTGWVGPLVLPGLSPCLGCVERHRTERDPAWPAVAAQLAVPAAATTDACAVTLAGLVASVAAAQVLLLLDAAPGRLPEALVDGTLGGTLEVRQPDWRIRRRSWAPHPFCPCRDEAELVARRRGTDGGDPLPGLRR